MFAIVFKLLATTFFFYLDQGLLSYGPSCPANAVRQVRQVDAPNLPYFLVSSAGSGLQDLHAGYLRVAYG